MSKNTNTLSKQSEQIYIGGYLAVIATPIGTLADWSARAAQICAEVDVIACEDTRVTGKLLHHYGIKTKMLPYHEHNSEKQRPVLLELLAEGKNIALVSDAGTPLISDPGYKLVRQVRAQGHRIMSVPGASSVTAALSIAGLPSNRFLFLGFLPNKSAARCKEIALFTHTPATLVIFESAQRITNSLKDLLQVLGNREAAIAREISKRYEEVLYGNLADLIPRSEELKGEIVLLVAPGEKNTDDSEENLDILLKQALEKYSLKEAVAAVASNTGLPKKQVYSRALEL